MKKNMFNIIGCVVVVTLFVLVCLVGVYNIRKVDDGAVNNTNNNSTVVIEENNDVNDVTDQGIEENTVEETGEEAI